MKELVEYFIDKKIDPMGALKLMAKTTHFLVCAITDDGVKALINDEEYEDESH
jgi:hypothetical protein